MTGGGGCVKLRMQVRESNLPKDKLGFGRKKPPPKKNKKRESNILQSYADVNDDDDANDAMLCYTYAILFRNPTKEAKKRGRIRAMRLNVGFLRA